MEVDDLDRIAAALAAAAAAVREHAARGPRALPEKGPGQPLTEADLEVDRLLRRELQRGGDGWLSEETRDDPVRLSCRRVWIVDPLDGTREFLLGIPECSVSIALVEDGHAVAGGVCNPLTEETFVGGAGLGVRRNGAACPARAWPSLAGALVLASRTEFERGEWQGLRGRGFAVCRVGSTAYKMALVAAGAADATWTLHPRHEWDVAGGAALVLAAGGVVRTMPSLPTSSSTSLPTSSSSPSPPSRPSSSSLAVPSSATAAAEEPRFNRAVPRFERVFTCAAAAAPYFLPQLPELVRGPG